MSCLSLSFLQALIVNVIVIFALVAIIKLLIPWLAGITAPIVGQILNIVLWAIIAILVIYIVFALLSCLLGAGGSLRLFH